MLMQYKVPQIRLRVLQFKIRFQVPAVPAQVPAVQVPVQGPVQAGPNLPVQPPLQPVPMHLVPAGMVVPAAQIIYQN